VAIIAKNTLEPLSHFTFHYKCCSITVSKGYLMALTRQEYVQYIFVQKGNGY